MNADHPRLPIRLMACLLHLKHVFNLSDEELVIRWSENVMWQYFSGQAHYTPELRMMPRSWDAAHPVDNRLLEIALVGRYKSLTKLQQRWLKRR